MVITDADGDVRWWTWAGFRANATLAATMSDLADAAARIDDVSIRLRNDLTPGMWRTATADVADRVCLAEVDDVAVDGLKFSEALPGGWRSPPSPRGCRPRSRPNRAPRAGPFVRR